MTDRERIEECLAHIRAYASVISTDNWRDILLRIEVERKALEALFDCEQRAIKT